MSTKNNIVAGGRRRLLKDKAVREEVARIGREIESRYVRELAGAGLLKRFFIRRRIRKEIRKEIEKLFPRDALYVTAPREES